MCNGARGVGEKWNSRLRLARDEIYGWASMRMGSKHLLDIEQNCNHIVIYEAAERERENSSFVQSMHMTHVSNCLLSTCNWTQPKKASGTNWIPYQIIP